MDVELSIRISFPPSQKATTNPDFSFLSSTKSFYSSSRLFLLSSVLICERLGNATRGERGRDQRLSSRLLSPSLPSVSPPFAFLLSARSPPRRLAPFNLYLVSQETSRFDEQRNHAGPQLPRPLLPPARAPFAQLRRALTTRHRSLGRQVLGSG